MDEDTLREEVREFINKKTLAAKLSEEQACEIASNVCSDLQSEYNMRYNELMDEQE